MNNKTRLAIAAAIAGASMMGATTAQAACSDVDRAAFEWAANVATISTDQFGFGLPMWMTMVDETGKVCHVYTNDSSFDNTGSASGNKAWLGSRVISAQKANTANAFSLDGLAISTGAISVTVYPGGSLYGLQHSNPVDTNVAYGGDSEKIGTINDPMVDKKIGGVNVFGGGLALYSKDGTLLGALGVSGDSSCADHNIAWKLRDALNLDAVPSGVSSQGNDNIINDIENGVSKSGWGHPICIPTSVEIAKNFSKTHPVFKK